MRSLTITWLKRSGTLLGILLLVGGCFAGSDEKADGKIAWVQDLAEGLKQADTTGKPTMLYFTADWCAPCLELKKHVFTDKRVAEASLRLVNVYIDVDKNPDALTRYKVRGIPAIFFLSPKGEMIARFSGDRSVGNFVRQMTTIADQFAR
jgi:thioredoxin:protein disulfide reductase